MEAHSRRWPRLRRLAALRDSLYGLADLLAGQVKLIRALEVHPEISGHAEILSKAQGRVRRYVPLSSQELIEAVRRHFDNVCQLFGRESDLLQLVAEDFSGVDRCAWHVFSFPQW